MKALNKQAIDFSQPLETENGEPVKYICHDVIEYKCARVCVDIATGVVYSSPYVGLKIRNKETTQRAKLREQIESAADAYWQFDNGWISDMKCGDLSHEYLLFVKEPKNVLALLDDLEAKEEQRANWFQMAQKLGEDLDVAEKRIAELEVRELTVKQFDDFQIVHYGGSEDYAKGYIDCQNNYNKALTAAGIGVKGE
ncbi:ead/Ea22-like family protein [Citrobacter sp. Cpo221]|uniref:ead/Ea22-like family protein n=1 Tax=Citrobacter sp. Cpo221 TaxID=2985155 RepID=UPI002575E35B|nr:ead/Ea22-like family protein [Citrobacter sp. Cpo221]MDM2756639.1 ead/Ea22-like family protein [Citrobacter sp. Cpo221]